MDKTYLHSASDLKQRTTSLAHGIISRKNIDEAVDQRRKQLTVHEKAENVVLNIC